MKKPKVTVKSLQDLHVYVLLFLIVIFAGILTWIIPAGEFEKTLVEETQQTIYVAGTYHSVESNGQTPMDIIRAVFDGWTSSAVLIFTIMMLGAWVKIVEDTGLITKMFGRLTSHFRGKEKFIVAVIILVLSILGGFGINPTLALLPLGVMLVYSLGYDGAVAFAMVFLSNCVGYAVGAFNVFSVGLAQEMAELPRYSGAGVRLFCHGISTLFLILFTLRYMNKIRKDPASSIVSVRPEAALDNAKYEDSTSQSFTVGDWINLAIFVVGFGVIIYGVTKLNWSMNQYGPVYLMMAILSGFFGKLGLNGTARSFVKGCQSMVFTAMIVGVAKAISIVLTNGNIIDTIVYAISSPISATSSVVGANLMFIANSVINIFIPSSTGQAATVMPLMIPISDLSGITRQVATLAFQFGDGISNMIIPTATSLFAGLGMCGMRYDKYLKWVMPVFLFLNVLGFIMMTVLQLVQWGG